MMNQNASVVEATITQPQVDDHCRCQECEDFAIKLARKASTRTGKTMSVVDTASHGLCVYDERTLEKRGSTVKRIIFRASA
jgi:hypothetical protein